MAGVQQELSKEFRELAGRFRRIASSNRSESEVKATAAVCGLLLPRMRDAGLISANIILEPSAAELQEHARQPDVIAHLWSTCWINFVGVLQLSPAAPIPNALALRTEHRGGPEQVVVGSTNNADWCIRAENFAAICDWLATQFEVPELTPNEARAKFCFDEWQRGKSLKEINADLNRHPEWESFDDPKHVRGPINAWGKRIGVEPRKGQPGRRPKSARAN